MFPDTFKWGYVIVKLSINMESKDGSLVQMMFLFNWVIFRFLPPFIFRGVILSFYGVFTYIYTLNCPTVGVSFASLV